MVKLLLWLLVLVMTHEWDLLYEISLLDDDDVDDEGLHVSKD